MKKYIKKIIQGMVALLGRTTVGQYIYQQIIEKQMSRTATIQHNNITLKFTVPNSLNKFRVDTFSTKEPETLDWIDMMSNQAVFWDIGANVGLYSCYAASQRQCNVFSFEPSVFNLELLARNIYINNLEDLVTIIPLPLTDSLSQSSLNMSTTQWGGALSTFGNTYGHDGKPLEQEFRFSTVGLSMEDAHSLLGVPKPDYIKMDVDGIEHLILAGGKDILKSVKGMLVEINDDFQVQAENSANCLKEAGLTLADKRRWQNSESGPFEGTYNQIWIRN